MCDRQKHWTSTRKPQNLQNRWLSVIVVSWLCALCQCQKCPQNLVTFEKVAGVNLHGVNFVPFYKGFQGEPSVTKECLSRCRATDTCQAMLLSYTSQSCMSSPEATTGKRHDIVKTAPPTATSLFEKICLNAPRCQRLWAFERVLGYEIAGFDDRTIPGVNSRLRCQELCLMEKGFFCRSGEYDYAFQQCRLSSEDRRSQPSSFRPAFGDVDYFENQCVPEGSSGCNYEKKDDVEIDRIDRALTATSEAECQQQCDNSYAFLCHAFSYKQATSTCSLSSDDTYNLGVSALRKRRGSDYYQKSNCLDIKLACTKEAMQLTLNTREPFNGRIYSKSQPYSCQVFGQKQKTTVFTMNVNGMCGVEHEGEGRLTNTIVIQYHPLIQQKGDKVIKLYCSLFEEDANLTVSKTFKVGPGLDTGATAVVNATAPTPNIRLRITDAEGRDVSDTKIGDPLFFRIEIDKDSVFGIFARNLTAKNGRNDRQILLTDEDGCPTDPRIFPGFEKVPGSKSLQARFLAFKFAGDPVVRFEVNVHFCLEECTPVHCSGAQNAWGKRRRKRAVSNDQEIPIVPDYPLVAAIVVEGSSFRDNETNKPQNSGLQEVPSDELVCTTKLVVVISALGAFFLQVGLLAACATCLLLNRKDRTRYKEDAASTITDALPPFETEVTSHRRFQ